MATSTPTSSRNTIQIARRKPMQEGGDVSSSNESERTDRSTSSTGSKRTRPTSPRTTSSRRPRKSTHTLRKEEKQQLLLEMEALQKQVDRLKRSVRGTSASSTQTHAQLQAQLQAQETTETLQRAMQQQFEQFADAQAHFSAIGRTQVISPLALSIRLGTDHQERIATLETIRTKRLTISRAFLQRRCGSLDPRKPFAEDQRFETRQGDFCAVRFGIMQFVGAPSLRHVYDVLSYYYRNIEINISERLGSLTIREDDDMSDGSATQNRLVTASSVNVLVESNTALFADFVDAGEDSYGLIAAEFIDDDVLYPYRPHERVRKDISMVVQLTAHTQRIVNDAGVETNTLVVVLTRWSYSLLHRPAFVVPQSAMPELRAGMAKWCESMHSTLRESLQALRGR